MMNSSTIDTINRNTMRAAVMDYAAVKNLSASEAAALSACAEYVRGKPILDLGVGAGRTVDALNALSKDYLGIDYVEEMVAECRRRYPLVSFTHADARSLTALGDNSFALIVFGCNGICMVDQAGRLAILKEVYRLLAPGGFFLFSTYNRDNLRYRSLFLLPDFTFTKHPLKLGIRVARYCLATAVRAINRVRFKPLETETAEYAIVNDVCHDYATMLYYSFISDQRRQLQGAGFTSEATVFDLQGHPVIGETRDDSLTWLTRKPC